MSAAGLAARRAWALPLRAHLLALAALLIPVALFLRPGDTFTADEGAYAIQVRALDAGSWEYDDRTALYDPAGRWFPLRNAEREGDRHFAYVRHPAYPLLLVGVTRVAGETAGLYALGLLGILGVAAAAWLVAAEIDARASRGAFWLAAASPAAVTGHLVLAHAPSAALAGTAVLAALRTRRAPSWRWSAVLLVSVATGCLLRSEAVLFGAALAAAMVVVPVRAGSDTAATHRFGMPVAIVATVGAAVVGERKLISSILGAPARESGVRGEDVAATVRSGGGLVEFLEGRLEGAWHSLLAGSHGAAFPALLVAVALAMVVFAGSVVARRRPGWPRDVCVALAAAVVLYGARLAVGADQSMTGLFAAWPAALLGLVVGLALGALRPAALLSATAGLFSLAVVATQYRFGGGFEWGGRFFSPAIVPIAVLACVGLLALRAVLPERSGARVLALAVVLSVVPYGTGLVVVRNVRPLLGDVVDEVVKSGASLVVTHSPALPQAAWRTYPDVAWLVVPRSAMPEAIARLRTVRGARTDVVVDDTTAAELRAAFPELRRLTGAGTARLGWALLSLPAPP